MNSISRISDLISGYLENLTLPNTPENLYDPLRYFMTLGGKRMRPILTVMGAELFGVKAESALPCATCVELFHNFTLIHDDIMDAAPLRRSKPTVHTKWDQNIAILSGDVLMVKAYQELTKQEPIHLADLMTVFNKTAIEVCEGQQMDMDFETRNDVEISEYIEMIRLKTSVLLGCALEMGAIVANADANDRKNLYEFGQEIGLAFQIKDDFLDLYGDPEKFGKQIGGDVIANKKTFLYLLALKNANAVQKETFYQLESEQDLEFKVNAIRTLFSELDVPKLTTEQMDLHFNKGIKALDLVGVSSERKKDLKELAYFLKDREN